MVLGHRPEVVAGAVATAAGPAPPAEKYTFSRPTDVAWDPQGNIFVSDGYGNNRVVKYDKNGRFLKQVGSEKAGSRTRPIQSAARDRCRRQGQCLRRGSRQQPHCRSSTTISPSRPFTTTLARRGRSAFRPGPHQYLFTSNSNPNGNPPGSWDITGEIYKMELDGTILGKFGHASKQFGGFQVVHMMDCRNPNEIIVAEIESWRVQKLMLKPPQTKISSAK